MKPTKEQIIQIGLKVVDDVFKEAYNLQTASATKDKVKVYSLGNDGYYEHDGWHFSVNSKEKYDNEYKSFFIYFLDSGVSLHMTSFLGDDKPRFVYAIKDKNNKYTVVDEDKYFKHQNFDFKNFVRKNF
ncbi:MULTISPECIES: hypothetical protein [unclassified Chryseobacterium]|uniref:hypothetical protein n=1 Tax=unclassified Chryseobacterium TaxID=2593645 RepID=UPI00115BB148|nr:hypothetical protein [Chryseobacterium sp. ON_d1]GEJ47974.1 hypothetical protein CRS_45830 [Chryseobacterium sp. ON_d1]